MVVNWFLTTWRLRGFGKCLMGRRKIRILQSLSKSKAFGGGVGNRKQHLDDQADYSGRYTLLWGTSPGRASKFLPFGRRGGNFVGDIIF